MTRRAQPRNLRWFATRSAAFVAGIAGTVLGLGCCAFSGSTWSGPATDHFDGSRFFTPGAPERQRFSAFARWQLSRQRGAWRPFQDAHPGPRPKERVGPGELRVTWVNHATALVQLDGLNILTDPIWSERPTPMQGIGPKRVRPPGIRFEELPPIDVVLLSHNHYDHLDLPTLKRLQEKHTPLVLAGLGNRELLLDAGLSGARELDWWDGTELRGLTFTSVPVQHFSNRGLCDLDRSLWTGFVISGPAGKVYFAGDTGFGPHFAKARERLGPFRLALLPIGAYEPEWFMGPVHVSPAEAVQAHLALGAGTSVGIHWGTFELADDGQDEPPVDLALALDARGVPRDRFWVLGFGEGRDVPAGAPSGTVASP